MADILTVKHHDADGQKVAVGCRVRDERGRTGTIDNLHWGAYESWCEVTWDKDGKMPVWSGQPTRRVRVAEKEDTP